MVQTQVTKVRETQEVNQNGGLFLGFPVFQFVQYGGCNMVDGQHPRRQLRTRVDPQNPGIRLSFDLLLNPPAARVPSNKVTETSAIYWMKPIQVTPMFVQAFLGDGTSLFVFLHIKIVLALSLGTFGLSW